MAAINSDKIAYEFRVHCRKLKSLKPSAVNAAPNTYVKCFIQKEGKWEQVQSQYGEVEVVKHCSEPSFGCPFQLTKADFSLQKTMKFSVYEKPSSAKKKPEEKFLLGQVECSIEQLMKCNVLSMRLMAADNNGFAKEAIITIFTEDVSTNSNVHLFKFSAVGLDDKDTLSVSDPYLEVHKKLKNDLWEMLHRTEVITDTLNPKWKEFTISTQTMLNHNFTNELKFVIIDYDDDGKHDFIGESVVSVAQLLPQSMNQQVTWPSINQHKKYRKGEAYSDSGRLILEFSRVMGGKRREETTTL